MNKMKQSRIRKHSLLRLICLSGCILILSACGRMKSDSAEYIGIEAAKEAAFQAAGLEKNEVFEQSAELEDRDGIAYYEVKFKGNETEYEYDIDAVTGVVIAEKQEILYSDRQKETTGKAETVQQTENVPDETAGQTGLLTEEQVRAAVIERVPGAAAEYIRLELDRDDGRVVYQGELYYDGIQYEFEMDAYSGTMLEWETERDHD